MLRSLAGASTGRAGALCCSGGGCDLISFRGSPRGMRLGPGECTSGRWDNIGCGRVVVFAESVRCVVGVLLDDVLVGRFGLGAPTVCHGRLLALRLWHRLLGRLSESRVAGVFEVTGVTGGSR